MGGWGGWLSQTRPIPRSPDSEVLFFSGLKHLPNFLRGLKERERNHCLVDMSGKEGTLMTTHGIFKGVDLNFINRLSSQSCLDLNRASI